MDDYSVHLSPVQMIHLMTAERYFSVEQSFNL